MGELRERWREKEMKSGKEGNERDGKARDR